MKYRHSFALALVATFACDEGPRANPVRDALAGAPIVAGGGTSVAFRFPAGNRATTKLYRLPDLEEVAWRFESGGGNIATVVGFAIDEDLVYSLSDGNRLVALDLGSGRTRILDSMVAMAAVGLTGTPHFIRLDGSVASIERRALQRWNTTFDSLPTQIWGGARQRLIALFDGDRRRLLVTSEGQPPIEQPLPQGQLAMARWGDIAAVATDSGIVVLNPVDPGARAFAKIPGATRVAFSPSAHRMYVGVGTRLLTLERFDLIVIDSLNLPGPIDDIRFDQLGLLAMLRPAGTDSVWIVDIVGGEITGAVPTQWGPDLPVIAYDGTLITRSGDRIVATLAATLGEAAELEGSSDRWSVAAWDPRRPALELATEVETTAERPLGQRLYVQVSSTHNADWAIDFAQNLRRADIEASVLPPGPGEELYRVVLGPYPTRDEAERTAQKLGLPFWIYSADSTGAPDSTSLQQD